MYLKSIELQGFKSFPDKTTLTFNNGITVVIGPNGSGKSNIADAVRWVLGEVSSRNIRGTKMEDVIFGGCETKKPGTYAQVSLTLDNSSPEHRLDVDYDTVTVTRRYFRGGDSDYLINGKAVRLKDIHKLFMNTGIGKGGYSVIGQGKIAEIISQKSEDRRAVFEEAAGISKFKYSRDEAEKKLKGVNENLTRVCDIAAELGSRVQPLERASEKAKKYLLLYEEKKQIDISLWLFDMAQLSQNIAKLRGTYEMYKRQLDEAVDELALLENKTEELFTLSQQNKRDTEQANDTLGELIEQRTGHGKQVIEARAEKEHIKSTIDELAQLACELEEKLAGARLAEKEKNEVLSSLQEECAQASGEYEREKLEYERITESLEELSREADELESEISALKESVLEQRIKLTVLDTTEREQEEQDEKISAQKEECVKNADIIKQRLERASSACAEYERQCNEARAAAESLKGELERDEGKRDGFKKEINDTFVKISTLSHRADNLQRMSELLEGYSHSVRFVMDEYKAHRIKDRGGNVCTKIYAPVSMLISVKKEYACAVETSLGAAMQNIVVEDEEAAKAAMYHLKKHNAGRCTFYPISTIRPQYLSYNISELEKNDGFVAVASELVECDGKFANIIKNLLGRTVVFSDIDRATTFAKKYDYKIRIVTLDGQQINAGGSFTGGSSRAESGILSRGAELEGLKKQIAELGTLKAELEKKLDVAESEISARKSDISGKEGNITILSSLLTQEQLQYNILKNQYDEQTARIAELNDSSLDSMKREEERKRLREAGELFIKSSENKIKELIESLDDKERRIGAGNARQEEYREKYTSSSARISGLEGQIGQVKQVCELLAQNTADIEAQLKENKEKSSQLTERLAKNDETARSGEKLANELDKRIGEIRERLAVLHSDGVAVETKLSTARGEEKEKSRSKELLLREYTQYENRLNNAENEKTKLVAFLNDNYELTYAEARDIAKEKSYPEITQAQRAETAKRQAQLKSKLRELGEVNVNAIEEYKTVKERYDFMSEQIKDLESSRGELEEVIFKAQQEMQTAFLDAFDRINEQFGVVFTHLFGGGRAELLLKDPNDVLNSGIEINAAPPGKIIKSLSLLSGGEQSFVAIALYFALLNVNPTPFILLDEIDSALDEVNVDRFGQYITECKSATQFILISHRRGTMEAADMLYGVTMQTKGISKVLSVNVDEIEQKIGKLN